jgi:hypothetical protein
METFLRHSKQSPLDGLKTLRYQPGLAGRAEPLGKPMQRRPVSVPQKRLPDSKHVDRKQDAR